MPTLFHGTRLCDAMMMCGTSSQGGGIDVTRGEGEFGQGFYTQESKAKSLAFVQNKFADSQRPCIFVVDVDDAQYKRLKSKRLSLATARRLTEELYKKGKRREHVTGKDVVIGPLNGDRKNQQHKFESQESQELLNGSGTTRSVL